MEYTKSFFISFILFSIQLIHFWAYVDNSFELFGETYHLKPTIYILWFLFCIVLFTVSFMVIKLTIAFFKKMIDLNRFINFNMSIFICTFSSFYIFDLDLNEIEFLIPSLLCFLIFGNLETYIINKK